MLALALLFLLPCARAASARDADAARGEVERAFAAVRPLAAKRLGPLGYEIRLSYHHWDDIDSGRYPSGQLAAVRLPGAADNPGPAALMDVSVEIFGATGASDPAPVRECKLGFIFAHELSHLHRRHGEKGPALRTELAEAWLKGKAKDPKVSDLSARLEAGLKAGRPMSAEKRELTDLFERDNRARLDRHSRAMECEADRDALEILRDAPCYAKVSPGTLAGAFDGVAQGHLFGKFPSAGGGGTHEAYWDRSHRVFLEEVGLTRLADPCEQ